MRLRAIRDQWIDDGLSRSSINQYTGLIVRMFRWAASHAFIPASVPQSFEMLENLKAGRTRAKESKENLPVSLDHIESLRPHISPTLRAMIDLQLATGARPGEIVNLRPVDIDMSESPWRIALDSHKTKYRGKRRVIYFGPRGQDAIRPLLNRPVHSFLFSPPESESWRYAQCDAHRRANQQANEKRTGRTLCDYYTVDTYRRAIDYACKRKKIPVFRPNQLRHSAATLIRMKHGLEAAQVVLGHSRADVTQIYALADESKAREVIAQIG